MWHGDHEDQQRQGPHRQAVGEGEARGVEPTGLDRARIRGENFLQQVLDHDRHAEGHDQRRQRIAAERAVQREALQAVACGKSDRQYQYERSPWRHCGRQPGRGGQRKHAESRQDDEIAVRGIGEPHHAEDQRLAHGKQCVQPAEQDALDEDINSV